VVEAESPGAVRLSRRCAEDGSIAGAATGAAVGATAEKEVAELASEPAAGASRVTDAEGTATVDAAAGAFGRPVGTAVAAAADAGPTCMAVKPAAGTWPAACGAGCAEGTTTGAEEAAIVAAAACGPLTVAGAICGAAFWTGKTAVASVDDQDPELAVTGMWTWWPCAESVRPNTRPVTWTTVAVSIVSTT